MPDKKISEFTALTGATLADADELVIVDTSAGETKRITWAELRSMLAHPGAIEMYGGSSAPTGWLLCDGDAVNRTTYAALFSAIGTAFGVGDGSTTFNVPNFQGVGVTGAGTQNINGRAKGGDSLGDTVEDAMQGHRHETTFDNAGVPAAGSNSPPSSNAAGTGYQINTGGAVTDGTNGTPRTDTVTKISSVVVNFIIKY